TEIHCFGRIVEVGDAFDQTVTNMDRCGTDAVRRHDIAAADDHVRIIAESVVAVTAPVRQLSQYEGQPNGTHPPMPSLSWHRSEISAPVLHEYLSMILHGPRVPLEKVLPSQYVSYSPV